MEPSAATAAQIALAYMTQYQSKIDFVGAKSFWVAAGLESGKINKDSIIDTLNQDKMSISNRMKEKIHNFVCEKLNKVHINMENTKNGIIDKALS